jgi:hypothetical protein
MESNQVLEILCYDQANKPTDYANSAEFSYLRLSVNTNRIYKIRSRECAKQHLLFRQHSRITVVGRQVRCYYTCMHRFVNSKCYSSIHTIADFQLEAHGRT